MSVKVCVLNSNGNHKGGLFTPYDYDKALTWQGRPHPDHTEVLFDTTGPGEPCSTRSWYLYRESKSPQLSGSEECDDLFDTASYALRFTPTEAACWLESQGYTVPEDLRQLVGTETHGNSDSKTTKSSGEKEEMRLILTSAQQEVWDLLAGCIMTAKEIASKLPGQVFDTAVIKRIAAIKTHDDLIRNIRGRGYYRPDAPPPRLNELLSNSD